MLYFAKRVLSAAISTSMILPFAASRFAFVLLACSRAKLSLDTAPPFSALNEAIFSIACVKKLTVRVDRSTELAHFVAARVFPVAPNARFVDASVELNVSALSSAALLRLTMGPDDPFSVV